MSWDCHAHVFGPYAEFPLAGERSYTPPEAPVDAYLALLGRLGLTHGVLVQPSAYGDDHGLLLHALASHAALRGVVVIAAGSTLASMGSTGLAGLRARGVRAARFSQRSGPGANFAGSASFDELVQMSGALADAGLHAELWTDCRALPALAARIAQLPVPVVIDHMGGFDVAAGVGEAGFAQLLRLLERGKVWVKLCAYRNLLPNLSGMAGMDAGLPFHRALVQANPDQLVWGSDWPHLRVEPAPDAQALFAQLGAWTGDAALLRRLLTDNPARLYR